jgi:Antitoxin VbhA
MEGRVGFPLTKPKITPEEMDRRREALRQADASNRIEGVFRAPETDAIFEAFIRGEIEADEIRHLLKALDDHEGSFILGSTLTPTERRRRQAAIETARASVGLEGFKITDAEEAHARRFVDGEIDLAAFVQGAR